MVYFLWGVGLVNFGLAMLFVFVLGQEAKKFDRLVAAAFVAISTINGFLIFLYLKATLVGIAS